MASDRNFDDLADKFEHKVYGSLKGLVRLRVLKRDLETVSPEIWQQPTSTPLNILDIGAGLGQLAVGLAECGHRLTVNDISTTMLAKAKQTADAAGITKQVAWHCCPYQQLVEQLPSNSFNLVLCHALMEWLAEPQQLIPQLAPLVTANGWLSLTFYNRHALVYRNLLRGNFRLLEGNQLSGDAGSLTPLNPQRLEEIENQLNNAGFAIIGRSGIRVFNDYVQVPRGGNQHAESILETELHYSNQEPYLRLGRYIHLLCRAR